MFDTLLSFDIFGNSLEFVFCSGDQITNEAPTCNLIGLKVHLVRLGHEVYLLQKMSTVTRILTDRNCLTLFVELNFFFENLWSGKFSRYHEIFKTQEKNPENHGLYFKKVFIIARVKKS